MVVRQDVRFEEDRAFRRSQELGDREPSTLQQQQQSYLKLQVDRVLEVLQ